MQLNTKPVVWGIKGWVKSFNKAKGWVNFHCKPDQMNKIGSFREISYTISEAIPSMFPSESCAL